MGLPQSTYGEIEYARELSTDPHLGFTDILPTLGAFLADQTGMGKTILVLYLIAWIVENHEYPEGENKPVLVLCPMQLVESWANDTCQKFPSLQIGIMYAGSRHFHNPAPASRSIPRGFTKRLPKSMRLCPKWLKPAFGPAKNSRNPWIIFASIDTFSVRTIYTVEDRTRSPQVTQVGTHPDGSRKLAMKPSHMGV